MLEAEGFQQGPMLAHRHGLQRVVAPVRRLKGGGRIVNRRPAVRLFGWDQRNGLAPMIQKASRRQRKVGTQVLRQADSVEE